MSDWRTVGRDPSGDVVLPSDQIQVSTRHCRARLISPGRVALEDSGSANGLFINGARVASGEVGLSDKLSFGHQAVDVGWLIAQLGRDAGSAGEGWVPQDGPIPVMVQGELSEISQRRPPPKTSWLPLAVLGVVALAAVLALSGVFDPGGGKGSDDKVPPVLTQGNPASNRMIAVVQVWDGQTYSEDTVILQVTGQSKNRLGVRVDAAVGESSQGDTHGLAFAGEAVRAVVDLNGSRTTGLSTPYKPVLEHLVASVPSGSRANPLTLWMPARNGVQQQGQVPIEWKEQSFEVGAKKWIQVDAKSTRMGDAQTGTGGRARVQVDGTWLWDADQTVAVAADVLVRWREGRTDAWTRLTLHRLDSDTATPKLHPTAAKLPMMLRGTQLSQESQGAMALAARSVFVGGAANAERAKNPIFCAAVAIVMATDTAINLVANWKHDRLRKKRDSSHAIDIFDEDVESPISWFFRKGVTGWAGAAAWAGLIDPSQVETIGYHGGKILKLGTGVLVNAGGGLHELAGGWAKETVSYLPIVDPLKAGKLLHGAVTAVEGVKMAFEGSEIVRYGHEALGIEPATMAQWASALVPPIGSTSPPQNLSGAAVAMPQVKRAKKAKKAKKAKRAKGKRAKKSWAPTPPAPPPMAQMPGSSQSSESTGATLLLIMDRSGSMGAPSSGLSPIMQAQQAIAMVADAVGPVDALGLIAFESSAQELVPITVSSGVMVKSAAGRMTPAGGTNFNAALSRAADSISRTGINGAQVVFVSDGQFQHSSLDKRHTARLRGMGVRLHTIAAGDTADNQTLCALAAELDGWCVAVTHSGLKATLAQMLEEARDRRVLADVRDVIRPGETQSFVLQTSSASGMFQLTGTWAGSDLAFEAVSPSGTVYSTDAPTSAGFAAGGPKHAYRVLRFPAERGKWTINSIARDVPASGEPYRVMVSGKDDGQPRLMPLQDGLSPGQSVEVSLSNCLAEAIATMYIGAMGTVSAPFQKGAGESCVATLKAPETVGLFPVSIEPKGADRVWTTLSVGAPTQLVAQRDQWRPKSQAWETWSGSGSGSGLLIGVLLIVGVGVLLVSVGRRTPAHGGAIGGRIEVRLVEPSGHSTPLSIGSNPVQIGRDPAQVDVVLSQPTISRVHVLLQVTAGQIQITNLAGPEATLLNGAPLPTGTVAVLTPGSTIRLAGGVMLHR